MSIYATLWALKFPEHGDYHTGCGWVEVIGQGVPAHIGTPTPGYGYESGDPYADFLPPAVPVQEGGDGRTMRAVVIVKDATPKDVQRYRDPLLVLSGAEYDATPFAALLERITEALRGERPRCVGEWVRPDGVTRLMFDDGSTRDVREFPE